MKKCKHIIGQYFHSSSELYNFSYGSERDGEETIAGYYPFCNKCGKRITEKIIKEYLKK